MIDATKLVDGGLYWIASHSDPTYDDARYDAACQVFRHGKLSCPIKIVTDAIPIPTPEELGVMRRFISDIAGASLDGQYIPEQVVLTARTLLEKMT